MAKSRSKAPAEGPSPVESAGTGTDDRMGRTASLALGVYLVAFAAVSGGELVAIWGDLQSGIGGAPGPAGGTNGVAAGVMDLDIELFVAAILAGALGSLLHAIQSFTMFIAHGRLFRRWLAWYLLRPFIGAMIASMLFLVVRGGFLTTGKDAVSLNALIALAAVGGMFSEPATKRLSEVAYAVFGTARDRNDALKDGQSGRDQ